MRSNTQMPLLQLAEFFGISPWFFAGVDLSLVNGMSSANKNKCQCILQHPWQQPSMWSRDDFISMIQYAEDVFYWETNIYPATNQILDARVEYKTKDYKLKNKFGQYKSVRLPNNCYFQNTGVLENNFIGLIALDTTDIDLYIATFNVPAGTKKEEIRLYFTPTDGDYITDPEPYERLNQIRPLRNISIVGTTCTVKIPTYLLVKPILQENAERCLAHEADTYVSELYAFYTSLSVCRQGYFIGENSNCVENCDEVSSPICFSTRIIGDSKWVVPKPLRCNEDNVFEEYCLEFVPNSVSVNYLTGIKELPSGELDSYVSGIISKLAVGLADCVKPWCDCDVCAKQKLDYYRGVAKTTIVVDIPQGQGSGEFGKQYQVLLSNKTLDLVNGYPPYLGLTMAFKELQQYKCYNVEGASL